MRQIAIGLMSVLTLLMTTLYIGGQDTRGLQGNKHSGAWASQEASIKEENEMEELTTVEQVWAGYDPESEPLEVEIIKEWTEDNCRYQKFYFTGESFDGGQVRIFAYYGVPQDGKNLPGILHIHGGGQTASLTWVQFWARRGYAAMSFDWCGEVAGRKEYTKWGNIKANQMHKPVMEWNFKVSVRETGWYHWTKAARRALTFLERQPEVDSSRLGIFGISMGAVMTWYVAGIDSRVKVAVPIHGGPGHGETKADPRSRIWRKTMAVEAYAPYVRCPLLYLGATNDVHFHMDRIYGRMLAQIPDDIEVRQAFTPRYNHHIEPEQGVDLPLWMDRWLRNQGPAWPQTPGIQATIGDEGIPQAVVSPDESQDISRVEVCYAIGEPDPRLRFWRTVSAQPGGDSWIAQLPTIDVAEPLFVFANVFYDSGLCLSSTLVSFVPSVLGNARATDETSLLIDDFSDGYADWIFVPAYTDPNRSDTYLRTADGPDGKKGFTFNKDLCGDRFWVGTHKVGDPRWRGPQGACLSFWVKSEKKNSLTIIVKEDVWHNIYKTEISVGGSNNWEHIILPCHQFKGDDGSVLASWGKVKKLELKGQDWLGELPIFSFFSWTSPETGN